jgi:hypothetical protein
MTKLTTTDERLAALGAALARAVNAGEVHAVDAGRVIRHELHRRKRFVSPAGTTLRALPLLTREDPGLVSPLPAL